jgi:hypothetical protein
LTKYGKNVRVKEGGALPPGKERTVPVYRVYAVPILSEKARRAAKGERVNPFVPILLPMAGFTVQARCWPAVEANSEGHVERIFKIAQHDPDSHELVEYRVHSIVFVSE